MNIEQVAQAATEFGNEAGKHLQALLGRVPDPQEFMTFYAVSCATICGNALSEIVMAANKETGAQWLSEVLGMVQLTARRNGADIVLSGGVTLKTVPSAMGKQQQAAPKPPPPALETNVCQCEISEGTCRSCERELDRAIDRFTGLIRNAIDISKDGERSKLCKVCKIKLVDAVLARSIRKNASGFGDRLPGAIEIFMAVVTPQLKLMMPEVSWEDTLKAVSEVASSVNR